MSIACDVIAPKPVILVELGTDFRLNMQIKINSRHFTKKYKAALLERRLSLVFKGIPYTSVLKSPHTRHKVFLDDGIMDSRIEHGYDEEGGGLFCLS